MPEGVPNNGEIGIDLGLKSFLVRSDGEKIDHPKHLQKAEKRLIRLQRQLSRRVKGSQGREKACHLLARQHEKVANQREDFLHIDTIVYGDFHPIIAINANNLDRVFLYSG